MNVSVIMSALNELYVEQTINDLLKNSGDELKEIIIVDDCSDVPINCNLPKTRIIRNDVRQGLIRSRNIGFKEAKSDILISVDPHVAFSENWLIPIILKISSNYKTIAIPTTRGLNPEKWIVNNSVGRSTHWRWNLDFYWKDDNDDLSPAFAGHCFAVSKDWYYELGGLDDGLNKWGGENIDFSLKSWLCGGTVELVNDCWVAHWFKSNWNYEFDHNSLLHNKARVAETWFGDYIELFYDYVNKKRGEIDFGDISKNIAIRDKLQVRSLDWFLNNLQPELLGVSKFKNIHKDKTFAILGASPCINDIDLKILYNFDVVIGINYVSLDHRCDYVIFHDNKPAFSVLKSGRYRPNQLMVPYKLKDGSKTINSDHKLGWLLYELGSQDNKSALDNINSPFFHHASTAHTAVHIAAFMGAKSITLIGCDGQFYKGSSHAKLKYYRDGKYWSDGSESQNYINRIIKGYDDLSIATQRWKIPLLRYGYI